MLIINRKDGESIDILLKRYKRKHRDVKLRNELTERKQFTKPSVKRRFEVLKAVYMNNKRLSEQ